MASKAAASLPKRTFNTTGTCVPSLHYMVDITEKVNRIVTELIANNCYFTINRARQYGKTTLLSRLSARLKEDYYVIRISFEGAEALFSSEQNLANGFLFLTVAELKKTALSPSLLAEWEAPIQAPLELMQLSRRITRLCSQSDREIVLMIDEVDKCAGQELFLSFLGLLRDKYIRRADQEDTTFKNVILASVYDIKNLKQKLRSDTEHHYNSPWNIAADFDIDLSFHPEEIAAMLQEYEDDHHFEIDIPWFSKQLYAYTSGYPYLVSRICQIIDKNTKKERNPAFQENNAWSPTGFQSAIKLLLSTQCTLFDDMNKNLDRYPELNQMIRSMLLQGFSYPYTISDNTTQLGVRFGYLQNNAGELAVSNRIFETYLYDMYDMQEKTKYNMAKQSSLEKSGFIHDGILDMDKIITRFKAHYDFLYSEQDWTFTEENGRFLFLNFLKPIINDTGNYYVEARTRDLTRTDIVVDYLGKQYIIELKIYRGNAYQQEGAKQLAQYLDHYGLDKGWLISFCFHKKKEKKSGIRYLHCDGRTIVEAIL